MLRTALQAGVPPWRLGWWTLRPSNHTMQDPYDENGSFILRFSDPRKGLPYYPFNQINCSVRWDWKSHFTAEGMKVDSRIQHLRRKANGEKHTVTSRPCEYSPYEKPYPISSHRSAPVLTENRLGCPWGPHRAEGVGAQVGLLAFNVTMVTFPANPQLLSFLICNMVMMFRGLIKITQANVFGHCQPHASSR